MIEKVSAEREIAVTKSDLVSLVSFLDVPEMEHTSDGKKSMISPGCPRFADRENRISRLQREVFGTCGQR